MESLVRYKVNDFSFDIISVMLDNRSCNSYIMSTCFGFKKLVHSGPYNVCNILLLKLFHLFMSKTKYYYLISPDFTAVIK